ncbi:8-oxo-dGTP diphosphatase [Gammaproteobacteria bacterium]|nr:8-oxo-dGTP diphosphatase [Gammaproteobacteria bacterium]
MTNERGHSDQPQARERSHEDPRSRKALVDWENWQPTMWATLLVARRHGEILLIEKQRGLGAGKITAPGGKIEPGETALAAAIREVKEEVGLNIHSADEVGTLRFHFLDGLRLHCRVFLSDDFSGKASNSDEAIPFWCAETAIPYDQMWQDDRYWLPAILRGHHFSCECLFDDEQMLSMQLNLRVPASDDL